MAVTKKRMEVLEAMTYQQLQGRKTELLNKIQMLKFVKTQLDPMGWRDELKVVEALLIEKGPK